MSHHRCKERTVCNKLRHPIAKSCAGNVAGLVLLFPGELLRGFFEPSTPFLKVLAQHEPFMKQVLFRFAELSEVGMCTFSTRTLKAAGCTAPLQEYGLYRRHRAPGEERGGGTPRPHPSRPRCPASITGPRHPPFFSGPDGCMVAEVVTEFGSEFGSDSRSIKARPKRGVLLSESDQLGTLGNTQRWEDAAQPLALPAYLHSWTQGLYGRRTRHGRHSIHKQLLTTFDPGAAFWGPRPVICLFLWLRFSRMSISAGV